MPPQRGYGLVVLFILVLALGYLGQTLIKKGLSGFGGFDAGSVGSALRFYRLCLRSPEIWSGVVAVGLGFLLWTAFLSRVELSKALPLLAFSYVPWLIIGRIVFGERIPLLRLVGVVLITLGVVCVGVSPEAGPGRDIRLEGRK
jgi:multidrug transporter EmrE-like cation transporter